MQKEHKAGREKHSKKKNTLKALKDRNISVEINSKKKMRGAVYCQGRGLFGIGQNLFGKLIITDPGVLICVNGTFTLN